MGIPFEAHADIGVKVGFRPEEAYEMAVVISGVGLVSQFVEADVFPEGVSIDPIEPELEKVGIDGCPVVGQFLNGFHLLGEEVGGMMYLVANLLVEAEDILGAVEVAIAGVRVDDDGDHRVEAVFKLAACSQKHRKRLDDPASGTSNPENIEFLCHNCQFRRVNAFEFY